MRAALQRRQFTALGLAAIGLPGVAPSARAATAWRLATSAVTGVEAKAWTHLRYHYDINAWFPKNIVFANATAMQALSPSSREALRVASAAAEVRGWAASEATAQASVDELRRNGIKVDRVPREVSVAIERFGEPLSLDWVRQVGVEANDIFIPYFTRS